MSRRAAIKAANALGIPAEEVVGADPEDATAQAGDARKR
jgi:hypothetical protein